MRKFMKGMTEAVFGIISGAILTLLLEGFAKDGLITGYAPWVFLMIGIVVNVATINLLKVAGVTYTLGWLVGAWLLRSMLSPVDFAFNVATPVLILALKGWYWIKRARDL